MGSYFMFANAVRSQVDVPGITAAATQIPIVNAVNYPLEIPVGKRLALTMHHEGIPGIQEIVYCTAIASNVLTVIRGREGTAPQAWIAGTVVAGYLTADILNTVANQDEMAAETLAQMLRWAENAEAASIEAVDFAQSAEDSAEAAAVSAAAAQSSAEATAQTEADIASIQLDALAAYQAAEDAIADAVRADQAVDEAEASAAQALQSAIDASGLGFQTATGTLLQGANTITLPWPCDTVRKNVAVYLGRTKEPQTSLTFVDETHIKIGGPVSQDTPYEVLSLVMSSASILTDFYNGSKAAALAAEAAQDGAQMAQASAELAQSGAKLAKAGAEAARDKAISAAADRDIDAWSQTHAYVATSLVTGSDGHKYICILGHTGVDPVGDNATYWVDLSVFGLQLGESETTAYRGDRGKAAYDHSQTVHAPANAQKNSNILKAEIEAVLTGIIESHSHPGSIPAGTVFTYAGATVPSGYLRCNGLAVSRTTYASLFAAIGTRYGAGDGSTTFNLPEVRGEFPRFWDDGRGVDSGRVLGSAQGDAIRNITGTFDTGAGTYGSRFLNGWGNGAFGVSLGYSREATDESGDGFNNATKSVSFDASKVVPTATENRPRNVAFLGIIKY
jgi:hypothetical protein